MIKFFRRIRQQLLTDNKFSKYLIYAIGEIVLVVIGIIIALQINNWNGLRKASNAELQLYTSLFEDLKTEHRRLERNLRSANAYDRVHSHVYDEINGKAEYDPEETYNFLLWFHRYNTFITERYAESMEQITNEDIRSRLKIYITGEFNTQAAVNEWNTNQLEQVRPYLSQHGINNTEVMFDEQTNEFAPIINTMNLIDHEKLKEQYGTQELDQLLFTIRFKTLWMAQNFTWLQESNREFQMIISREMSATKLSGSFEAPEPETIDEFALIGKTDEEIVEIITMEFEKEVVYDFTRREINVFGYDLLKDEKYSEALKVFRANIELYPDFYTHDSYGEGLLRMGDTLNAIKAYRKSLELNPDHENAKKILSEIE